MFNPRECNKSGGKVEGKQNLKMLERLLLPILIQKNQNETSGINKVTHKKLIQEIVMPKATSSKSMVINPEPKANYTTAASVISRIVRIRSSAHVPASKALRKVTLLVISWTTAPPRLKSSCCDSRPRPTTYKIERFR